MLLTRLRGAAGVVDAPRTAQQRRERRDAEAKEAGARGEGFRQSRNAETTYGRSLRQLARQVARIVESIVGEAKEDALSPATQARVEAALSAYAKAIAPWARATTSRMIAEVDRRDRTAWAAYTKHMGVALRAELQRTPIGAQVQELLQSQVGLITSLPVEAAQRVHEKTLEAITLGQRAPEHEAEIRAALAEAHPAATEAWLLNRATLIARTETARTASVLTQTRAEHVGSQGYVWRTARDINVRPSHRALEGSVQRWDAPPLSDPPDHHSHPGQIWNCRCVALPVLPGG